MMSEEQPFVWVTTPIAYRIISEAAKRRNMAPDQYASFAIQRLLEEDGMVPKSAPGAVEEEKWAG